LAGPRGPSEAVGKTTESVNDAIGLERGAYLEELAPAINTAPRSGAISRPATAERWNAEDLTYWTVSDLDARDLRGFVDLFRAQMTP